MYLKLYAYDIYKFEWFSYEKSNAWKEKLF